MADRVALTSVSSPRPIHNAGEEDCRRLESVQRRTHHCVARQQLLCLGVRGIRGELGKRVTAIYWGSSGLLHCCADAELEARGPDKPAERYQIHRFGNTTRRNHPKSAQHSATTRTPEFPWPVAQNPEVAGSTGGSILRSGSDSSGAGHSVGSRFPAS